ncbi:MAG: hypothetical protein H6868_08435 [Rhodospirillales bacterium]|nr:hypothetical protein [Rhodospirillales bacterium]
MATTPPKDELKILLKRLGYTKTDLGSGTGELPDDDVSVTSPSEQFAKKFTADHPKMQAADPDNLVMMLAYARMAFMEQQLPAVQDPNVAALWEHSIINTRSQYALGGSPSAAPAANANPTPEQIADYYITKYAKDEMVGKRAAKGDPEAQEFHKHLEEYAAIPADERQKLRETKDPAFTEKFKDLEELRETIVQYESIEVTPAEIAKLAAEERAELDAQGFPDVDVKPKSHMEASIRAEKFNDMVAKTPELAHMQMDETKGAALTWRMGGSAEMMMRRANHLMYLTDNAEAADKGMYNYETGRERMLLMLKHDQDFAAQYTAGPQGQNAPTEDGSDIPWDPLAAGAGVAAAGAAGYHYLKNREGKGGVDVKEKPGIKSGSNADAPKGRPSIKAEAPDTPKLGGKLGSFSRATGRLIAPVVATGAAIYTLSKTGDAEAAVKAGAQAISPVDNDKLADAIEAYRKGDIEATRANLDAAARSAPFGDEIVDGLEVAKDLYVETFVKPEEDAKLAAERMATEDSDKIKGYLNGDVDEADLPSYINKDVLDRMKADQSRLSASGGLDLTDNELCVAPDFSKAADQPRQSELAGKESVLTIRIEKDASDYDTDKDAAIQTAKLGL